MLLEITVKSDKLHTEALADALIDAGAYSVTIADADADTEEESPLFGEPGLEPETCAWDHSLLKILAGPDFPIEAALTKIGEELGIGGLSVESKAEVPDNDWVRITQAQFQPTQISNRLWIVPTWHEPPNKDAINIRLDPGYCFRNGLSPDHASLSAMAGITRSPKQIGSGLRLWLRNPGGCGKKTRCRSGYRNGH